MPAAFPTLLAPIRVGAHTLRNRALMGSMHTRLEGMDRAAERLAMFYGERARGGAGLIVTGGYAPNSDARIDQTGPELFTPAHAEQLKTIPRAVHAEGGKIILQILHPGRYAKIAQPVGASTIPSRINPRVPRALATAEVWQTIEDYVRCAELAQSAGFDGVEVMGSEGYLINQFAVTRTNDRADEFGGSVQNRHRFAVEIVRRTRARLGPEFLLMYRVSALDLVEGGAPASEIVELARAVEAAGADIINTGIGWHEARIPTIAYVVPRAAWRFAAARVKRAVAIPVIASNRINMPEVAEEILASGDADMVSMARPFLADADFMRKAAAGRPQDINTCIACNQACLDYIFSDRPATCLVNPRAGRELEFSQIRGSGAKRRVAVVGAGAAGLACAVTAAQRGHAVTLFEAAPRIGGHLNLARAVPSKKEFDELLRYFRNSVEQGGVELRLKHQPSAEHLAQQKFDHVVVATGVRARVPNIEGIGHAKVIVYADLLSGRRQAGRRVAIIGAGGIGFDVAEFLLHDAAVPAEHAPAEHAPAEHARAELARAELTSASELAGFHAEWGVDTAPGGLTAPQVARRLREVTLLQRKPEKPGRTLGLSTGWALRAQLERRGLRTLSGCTYERIDDAGLHVSVNGESRVLMVDSVIVCAGQDSENSLAAQLQALGVKADVIGGAQVAAELDALRAIEQGTRIALAM